MSSEYDDPLHRFQRDFERLFHGLVYQRHPASHFREPAWSPPADLVASEQYARVILELAGVPRENVRVRLQGRVLEVTGRRRPPQERADANYHRAEIMFGDFRRTIELPWEADEDRVEAHYRNGMLEIHLFPAPTPGHTDVRVEHHQPE